MNGVRPVRRALLAVYDKSGVVELARGLAELGVALVSSGVTAATLRDGDPPSWRLGAVAGRGHTFVVVDETAFASREDAEHAVFLRRLGDYGLA